MTQEERACHEIYKCLHVVFQTPRITTIASYISSFSLVWESCGEYCRWTGSAQAESCYQRGFMKCTECVVLAWPTFFLFFSFLLFLSFFLFLKGKKLLGEKSSSALCVCMKPKQAVCEHEVNYCKTVQLMIFHSKTKNLRQWKSFLEGVITAVFCRVFIGCSFIPYRLLHKIHCKKTVANRTRCFRVVL